MNERFCLRCKEKCLVNVATELKRNVLTKFLNMCTKNEQDIHLQRMIDLLPIKRRKPRMGVPESKRKPKKWTPVYNISLGGIRHRVCKSAFLNVHGVTKKRVERIVDLLAKDQNPVDMRGKNMSGNKIPEETRQQIHDHISSFPTHLSHYTGVPTKYLSPDLNVATMFQLYKNKFPEDKVSYAYYWGYFALHFNLRFGRPAKDCCGTCESIGTKLKKSSLNDTDKMKVAAELMVHKIRSRQFYKEMERIKNLCQINPKVSGLALDFMSNVSLPTIPVQELYYMRQLTVNTFGIHDLRNEKMVCYPYNEFDGHKGPNEVCTFLLDYIKKYVGDEVTSLFLFADNCGGQNKNHTLLRLAMALVELNLFEEVTITFPVRGHSYMPCDRDFGLIKRKMKTQERMYTLQQYESVIKRSSNIPDKFRLEKVQVENIIDFKGWWGQFYKKQCLSSDPSLPKMKFLISQYCYFNVNKNACGEVTCKNFINDQCHQTFILRKNTKEKLTLPITPAYTGKLPILSSKMSDIKKIVKFIPEDHLDFWEEVQKLPTRNEKSEQDDEE